jgi:hypothetical protein
VKSSEFRMSTGAYRSKLETLIAEWNVIHHSFRKTLSLSFDHYTALSMIRWMEDNGKIHGPFGSYSKCSNLSFKLTDLPKLIQSLVRKSKRPSLREAGAHIMCDYHHLYVFHKAFDTTLTKKPFLVVHTSIAGTKWQIEVVHVLQKHRSLVVLEKPESQPIIHKLAG